MCLWLCASARIRALIITEIFDFEWAGFVWPILFFFKGALIDEAIYSRFFHDRFRFDRRRPVIVSYGR